jgi:tripartite-type tricarboxylate transporter receptor subunit TctC
MSVRHAPAVLFLALAATSVCAQPFPARPIRVIVPYAASSTPDIAARLLGPKLSEAWGQPVVVENVVGANGIIAGEALLKAPRDGHAIAMIAANHVVNPHLYSRVPFDVVKDFGAVTAVAAVTFILVAHPSVPAADMKALLALARARPGTVTFGSAGSGSPGHLAGQLLASMAGISLLHVPYKGIAQALVDTAGGQIALSMSPSAAALPHVVSKRLRALGVTSRTRSIAAPDVPTIAESGVPGYELTAWIGVVTAAGVPAPLIARLHGDVTKALAGDVRARLEGQGVDVLGTTPERFAEMIAGDAVRYGKLVRESGAKLD